MELSNPVIVAVCLGAYVAVAWMSYGPYGLVEQAAGYAGAQTPDGGYAARQATRAMWLIVAVAWPVTLVAATAGYVCRRIGSLAAWLRTEV